MTTRGADGCAPGTTPTEAHAIGDEVASALAATLKALAEPLRLRMLSAIASSPAGEACVCDLASLAQVSQPTVSHHLKVLKDVGILGSERRGTWVWYRIEPAYRGAVTALLDRFAPSALDARSHEKVLHGLDDVSEQLESVAASLAARYAVAVAECRRLVRESYTGLLRRGGNPAYLVPLTENFARQRLVDAARAAALESGHREDRPQVLFVCVANAGRSQLAAALVRHYAGDRVVVRSAGSAPGGEVHATVRQILAGLADTDSVGGVDDVTRSYPKPLTDDAVRAADVVVTMGCGDVCPVLPGKRYEDWVVGDPALASPAGVAAIRDELDTRVRALLTDLLPDLDLPAR